MPKAKAPKLDAATLDVVKRVLALPPKQNKDLKVGRVEPKKRDPTPETLAAVSDAMIKDDPIVIGCLTDKERAETALAVYIAQPAWKALWSKN